MDNKRSKEIGAIEVLPGDVLLGRGKTVHNHVGNVEYRSVVKARSRDYQTRQGIEKDAVAREVIQTIHERKGRFLRPAAKEHRDGSQWEVCPGSIVCTKVKQALRDDLKPKASLKQENLAPGRDTSTASNKRKRSPVEVVPPTNRPTETGAGDRIGSSNPAPQHRASHDNDMRTRSRSAVHDPLSQRVLDQLLMTTSPSPYAAMLLNQQSMLHRLQSRLFEQRTDAATMDPVVQLAALRSQQLLSPLLAQHPLLSQVNPVAGAQLPLHSLAVRYNHLLQPQQGSTHPSNPTLPNTSSSSGDTQIVELLRRLRESG